MCVSRVLCVGRRQKRTPVASYPSLSTQTFESKSRHRAIKTQAASCKATHTTSLRNTRPPSPPAPPTADKRRGPGGISCSLPSSHTILLPFIASSLKIHLSSPHATPPCTRDKNGLRKAQQTNPRAPSRTLLAAGEKQQYGFPCFPRVSQRGAWALTMLSYLVTAIPRHNVCVKNPFLAAPRNHDPENIRAGRASTGLLVETAFTTMTSHSLRISVNRLRSRGGGARGCGRARPG